MAFLIPFSNPTGDDLGAAYSRFRSASIEIPPSGGPIVVVRMDVFTSKDARQQGKKPLGWMDFTFRDVPEKTETVRKIVDGKEVEEEKVTPAVTDGTDALSVIMKGGDLRAEVYAFLAARRPEFKDRPDEA